LNVFRFMVRMILAKLGIDWMIDEFLVSSPSAVEEKSEYAHYLVRDLYEVKVPSTNHSWLPDFDKIWSCPRGISIDLGWVMPEEKPV